ncbi:hypothetical protein CVT26_001757 [Gymnopilus dilepis]|uniref:Uncharacterized protein n=1 Tax=Gymnopilus dilepis TaxID=231916 RepID=A0A409WEA4_9AGAR|nr:hypothetical protein CVT26_001757 [Gymnopilus dilepis]
MPPVSHPIEGCSSRYIRAESERRSASVDVSHSSPLVISAAMRKEYERKDQERIERNEERKRRREMSAEADVSEDEEDVVIERDVEEQPEEDQRNFMDNEGNEREHLPYKRFAVEDVSSKTLSSPMNEEKFQPLITYQEAANFSFIAHDTSIPEPIKLLVKYRHCPPLALFTTDSLERIKIGRNIKYTKIGTGEHGPANTKILDVSDFPSDCDLSYVEWIQAYNTFLSFLTTVLDKNLCKGFLDHWDGMLKDPGFAKWFPAYRRFDQRIRQAFFTHPFVLDTKDGEYTKALMEAKTDYTNTLSIASTSTSPPYRSETPRRGFHPYIRRSSSFPHGKVVPSSSLRKRIDLNVSLITKQFASGSTSVHAKIPCHTTSTFAPSVATKTTLRVPAPETAPLSNELSRITTPYNANEWSRVLDECNLTSSYPNLVHDLLYGSPIGNPPSISETFIPDNMPSAHLHPEIIEDFLLEERDAGRMSGPFSFKDASLIFRGPFRTAPLGLVEKEPGTAKFRMIRNFSARDQFHTSTNDWLDSHDIVIKWHSCYSMADTIASAPPGAQVASLDVVKAYRNSPIMPSHKAYIPIQWDGLIWVDHNAPFGLATSGNIQGTVGDATVDVVEKKGADRVLKWVDNFNFFRFPIGQNSNGTFIYAFDLERLYAITNPLGIPWHPIEEEGNDFAFETDYLGFHWNIAEKTVQLVEKKRMKYLTKLQAFLQKRKASKKDVTSIHGTLQHVAFVFRDGRSFLPTLSKFAASFRSKFTSRTINSSIRNELSWWLTALSIPNVKRTLNPRPTIDPDIWVDASTSWGIGLVVGERWAAWHCIKGWKSDGRDIGWAEAVAIELAVLWLTVNPLYHDAQILIRGDNTAVIDAYRKGRSTNKQRNLVIRRIAGHLAAVNMSIVPFHVCSEDNRADPISRGNLGPSHLMLQTNFELPLELTPFLQCIV